MDQTEVAIHEIEVQVQAVAPSGLNIRVPFLEAEGEGAAGFEDGEDAHQPFVNCVALGQFSSCVLLSDNRREILKWPLMLFSHGDRVLLHAFGVLQQEGFEAAAIHLKTIEELRHRPTGHDGKVATKQHAVETGKHTVNASFVFADKLLHGNFPLDGPMTSTPISVQDCERSIWLRPAAAVGKTNALFRRTGPYRRTKLLRNRSQSHRSWVRSASFAWFFGLLCKLSTFCPARGPRAMR